MLLLLRLHWNRVLFGWRSNNTQRHFTSKHEVAWLVHARRIVDPTIGTWTGLKDPIVRRYRVALHQVAFFFFSIANRTVSRRDLQRKYSNDAFHRRTSCFLRVIDGDMPVPSPWMRVLPQCLGASTMCQRYHKIGGPNSLDGGILVNGLRIFSLWRSTHAARFGILARRNTSNNPSAPQWR